MSPRTRRLLPWISLFIVYTVWGSTYLAIRIVVREAPVFTAGAIRYLLAGSLMAVFAAFRDRAWPTLRQIWDYSLVGALLLAFANLLVMWAEVRTPSGVAALVVASIPLWLTFLDGLRPGGQKWTLRVWVGTLVGLAGVALVARPEGRADFWGIAALELACFCWASGSLYAQSVSRRLPLLSAAAVEMLAGGIVLVLESALAGEDPLRMAHVSSATWGALIYLVIFGSLVGFTAFAYCLNELPASTVGTYAYVNPVVAVVLGYLVLGEPVSAGLVFGAVLILAAILLSTKPQPKKIEAPREEIPREKGA